MNDAGALEGLKRRVLRASGWSVLTQIASQAVRFGGSLVMTRLLVPELFGVTALAMTFIFALNMFSDLGLGQVVMRHPVADDKEFLNTVWTLQILRGALIGCAGLLVALGLIALGSMGLLPTGSAYAHPALPSALMVISCSALVSGLESTKTLTASRGLALRPLAILELASQVVGLGVTIGWALISPTIFAVAGGAMASGLTRTALSHVLFEGISNRLFWSREHFNNILSFGRWIFLTSVLGFLISSGDRLLLGGFIDAKKFGIYTIAAMIVGVAFDVGGRLINTVIYPALNEAYRRDPASLKSTYYRLRAPVDAVCCGIAGIMITAGPAMIHFLYDQRYTDAGLVVQILSIPMIFLGLSSGGNLYMVIGKPWLVTILIAVRLVGLYASVPPLVLHFGLAGGAMGVVVGHLVTVPAMFYMKVRHGFFSLGRELLGIPFIFAGLMVGLGLTYLLGLVHR